MLGYIGDVYQREGDPERSMKFLGARWIGVGFRAWFLFSFIKIFSRAVSNDPPGLVTHPWPARDPPATHPWMITRHKKNSAQFRPFSMKPVQYYAKFRDAAREDDPVVITRQISIVFEEILNFQEKSDEPRRKSANFIFPKLVQDHSRSVPELEKHRKTFGKPDSGPEKIFSGPEIHPR